MWVFLDACTSLGQCVELATFIWKGFFFQSQLYPSAPDSAKQTIFPSVLSLGSSFVLAVLSGGRNPG